MRECPLHTADRCSGAGIVWIREQRLANPAATDEGLVSCEWVRSQVIVLCTWQNAALRRGATCLDSGFFRAASARTGNMRTLSSCIYYIIIYIIICILFICHFTFSVIYLIVINTLFILNGRKTCFWSQNKAPLSLCTWMWEWAVLWCLEFFIIN